MTIPLLYHAFRWDPGYGDQTVFYTDGMTISFDLWKVNINNKRVENISEDMIDGSITLDVTSNIPLSASFTLRNPAQVTPYVDYLAPFLNIDYDDRSTSIHEQLGIYAVSVNPGTYTVEDAHGVINGSDLCSVLADDHFSSAWSIASGTNVVTAIIAIINSAGISRCVIPATTRTLPKKKTFHTGTDKLTAVNYLLKSISYFELCTSTNGYVHSPGPTFPIKQMYPWKTLTAYDVYSEVEIAPTNMDRLANVVIVTAQDQNGAALKKILTNSDDSSPTSTTNLGRRIVKEYQLSGKVTQADVDEYARKMLERGRTYYRTASFTILPTWEAFDAHKVVDLDLDDEGNLDPFSGRWWITGATMGFTAGNAGLKLTLNQLTRKGLATDI